MRPAVTPTPPRPNDDLRVARIRKTNAEADLTELIVLEKKGDLVPSARLQLAEAKIAAVKEIMTGQYDEAGRFIEGILEADRLERVGLILQRLKERVNPDEEDRLP